MLERTGYQAWLLDELDGDRRLRSLQTLRAEAGEYASAAAFLTAVRAAIEADLERPDEAGVQLLTIHAAKGLQFHTVFVVGLEEGVLPDARALETGDEAGERRLAHVAFSRAEDALYLMSARARERHGRRAFTRPSRYLTCLAAPPIERRGPEEFN